MSILTDLLHKRITFRQAADQAESWGAQIAKSIKEDPTVVATTGAVVSALKQDASDAVTLADSLAGPIIAGGADAIEAAADVAFKAYFGPFAPIASKASHDGVDRIAAGLTALIASKAAAFKASMAEPAAS